MNRDFAQLADQHFDVLVCGGIYGAWTAYDAASLESVTLDWDGLF